MFLSRTTKDNPPVTFAIAACESQNVTVTVLPSFGLCGENYVTARDMWGTMLQVILLWLTTLVINFKLPPFLFDHVIIFFYFS